MQQRLRQQQREEEERRRAIEEAQRIELREAIANQEIEVEGVVAERIAGDAENGVAEGQIVYGLPSS